MAKVKIGDFDTSGIEDSKLTINELRKSIKDLKNELLNLDSSTKEYNSTAAQLGTLQHKLTEINEVTKASAADLGQVYSNCTKSLQGLSGAIQGGMAVMSLFGVESEEATKAIQKMQSIMALTQSFTAIDSGAKAFKGLTNQIKFSAKGLNGFKKALIGTGLGAIVVVLGTLIANWDELTAAIGISTETMDKFATVISGVGNAIKNYILAPFKAVFKVLQGDFKGAVEEFKNGINVIQNYEEGAAAKSAEIEEEKTKAIKQALADELDFTIKVNEAKFGSDYKFTEEGKKLYAQYFEVKKALADENSKEAQAATLEQIKYEKTLADEVKKQEEEKKKAREEAAKERKKQKEEEEKEIADREKAHQSMVEKIASWGRTETENKIYELEKQKTADLETANLTAEEKLAIETHYNEEIQKIKDEQKVKEEEERQAELEQLALYNEEIRQSRLTEQELELEELQSQYESRLELYKKYNLDIADLDAWYNEQRTVIYNKGAKEVEKNAENFLHGIVKFSELSIEEQAKALTTISAQATTTIVDLLGALSSNMEEGSKEWKGMQIAMATMTMLQGIVEAMAGTFTTHSGIWDIAIAVAQAASIAATGAINITKIKNTNPKSQSSTTPTISAPTSSAAAAISQAQQTKTNINDIIYNNSAIRNGEATGASVENAIQSQRVYVLESDITTTQNKVAVLEEEATF